MRRARSKVDIRRAMGMIDLQHLEEQPQLAEAREEGGTLEKAQAQRSGSS